jgi:hypothetical protein
MKENIQFFIAALYKIRVFLFNAYLQIFKIIFATLDFMLDSNIWIVAESCHHVIHEPD